ncbi:hypothetical protein M378DRAFT_353758 [Amanita muscaria Koide BX008]|uniref:Transmembrane protein n=1 Tax=Amanita muscaria (strain Koide BX008) TaxID=946122 RepID=A0A0C2XDF4_AMAMK|nr:hypothetical protein M378DRAFT_353758 [Amanita muscaria Koide BX008]
MVVPTQLREEEALDHNHNDRDTTTNQLRLRRNPTEKMPRNHQGGIYDRLENGGAGGLSIRLGEILGGRGERRNNGQEYNGYGGGPGGERIRFTWKKLFIGAVVFVGLVWVVGPRMRRGWGANEHKDKRNGHDTF